MAEAEHKMGYLGQYLMYKAKRAYDQADAEAAGRKLTGLLGQQEALSPVDLASGESVGRGLLTTATPENILGIQRQQAASGSVGDPAMAGVPTENLGGLMTPIALDALTGEIAPAQYQEATGVYSQDPTQRAQTTAQIAAMSPAVANAITQGFSTADQALKGQGAQALTKGGAFFDPISERVINYGTDAAGLPVDLSTGQRVDTQGLVPYSTEVVNKAMETKEKARRAETVEEAIAGAATPELQNVLYSQGIAVSPDGTVERDVHGTPKELKPGSDLKRGAAPKLFAALDIYDDAREVAQLVSDPETQTILQAAEADPNVGTTLKDLTVNKFRKWAQGKGYSTTGNAKVEKLIAHAQMLSSEKRKEYLGTAMSAQELATSTPWLPDAGDSLAVLTAKMTLMEQETRQMAKRRMDFYGGEYNLSQLYDTYGMARVGGMPSQVLGGGGIQPVQPAPAAVNPYEGLSDEELLGQL